MPLKTEEKVNSVCLACYNGEKFILEQIESILKQLNFSDELLISDDGSTDNTLAILDSLKDKRVKIFKNNFGSHVRNFEFLLEQAKGNYIFLSDQDDIWMDQKVDLYTKYFKTTNNELIISDCIVTDQNLVEIKKSFLGIKNINSYNTYSLIKSLYMKPSHYGCCMAMTKRVVSYCLPFPKNIESHDRWIGFCSRLKFNVIYIPERLIYFRRHETNVSNGMGSDIVLSGKSPYPISSILFRRLRLIYYLFIQYIKKY